MNISPIRFNSYYNKTVTNKIKNSPAFGSVCADADSYNQQDYAIYTLAHRGYNIIKSSSTRIFRELPSEIAIAKLLNLNPNQKSQIKILGCSDGSEAWGHAIIIKEVMGENAKNVNIQAVDRAPHMIETAKTKCLVLSDKEHQYAEGKTAIYEEKSPIAYDGWNKYLTLTNRPDSFNQTLRKYPFMKYLEYDPVVNKKIGSGLNWYEINREGLPEVSFECGDMFNYLKPDDEAQNVVYVVANSAAYFLEEENGFAKYISLFHKIKEKSRGKNAFVVIGNTEDKILNSGMFLNEFNRLNIYIEYLGFKNIPKEELEKLGINSLDSVSTRIYKLEQ